MVFLMVEFKKSDEKIQPPVFFHIPSPLTFAMSTKKMSVRPRASAECDTSVTPSSRVVRRSARLAAKNRCDTSTRQTPTAAPSRPKKKTPRSDPVLLENERERKRLANTKKEQEKLQAAREAMEWCQAQRAHLFSLLAGPTQASREENYHAFQTFCLGISGLHDTVFIPPEIRQYLCAFVVKLKVCTHDNRCVILEGSECCECNGYDRKDWCRACVMDHTQKKKWQRAKQNESN
jgi:hypothetical protein